MSREKAKSLAHELTIEYSKENDIFKCNSTGEIPNFINEFVNSYQAFYDAIIHNHLLNNFY